MAKSKGQTGAAGWDDVAGGSNGGKQSKQDKRAKRRADREAARAEAERLVAEQEAKERRNTTIIGVVVVLIIVALIGFAGYRVYDSHQQSTQATETAQRKSQEAEATLKSLPKSERPAAMSSEGAVILTKDGVVSDPDNHKVADGTVVVDTYFDLQCPGCAYTEQTLSESYANYLKEGKIELRLHPISFMNAYSSDKYSERVDNALVMVAEYEPDKFYPFMQYALSSGVFPGEGSQYKGVSDKDIQKYGEAIGLKKNTIDHLLDKKYSKLLTAATDWVVGRTDLMKTDGTGGKSFSTPVVTVNGKMMNMSADNYVKEFQSDVEAALGTRANDTK